MPTLVIAILVIAVIVLACALPVVIGVLATRRLKRTNPNSEFLKPLQAPAILSVTISILGLLLLVITRALYPNSPIGSLLQAPEEIIVASVIWLVAWSLIGKALFKVMGKYGV